MFETLYNWWYGVDPATKFRSVVQELEEYFASENTKEKSESRSTTPAQ